MSLLKKILVLVVIAGGVWVWWHVNEDEPTQIKVPILELPALEVSEPEVVAWEVEVTEAEAQEVVVRPEVVSERFFYSQLNEEQQGIFRVLRDGVERGDDEIQIDTNDAGEVHRIFRLVMFDYPEFFWATGSAASTVYEWSDGRVYTVFEPEYGHTGEEREAMQAEIEGVVESFLASVEPGLSEYELVRVVYEYIISTTTYDLDAPDHQNIYSVFVNRASVCAGFSRAAQLLLNRLGIFSTYVVGTAYVPGKTDAPIPHAWNLVRVYGEYYYLDVTWGSPVFQEDSTLTDRIEVLYDYLLVNEALLFRTHTLDENITMPPTTSLQHNFFVMNGMFYDAHDEARVLEAMNGSILEQEDWVAFKFATPELYETMRPIILDDLAPQAAGNLATWHGLGSARYYVREKENLNMIIIYWVYE